FAAREHLRLAGDRPVLVSERDRPRPAGNRGGDALRCDCLHPRQHDRRHPLRRHRSAGRAGMSTASFVSRPVTSAWRRIPGAWRQPLTVVGLVVVVAWLVVALLAPLMAPYDPLAQGSNLYQAPSATHLLGTDELGRDVFSRVLWGARISIPLAMLLVVLAFLIGGTLGGLAGYLGGWVDELVMRGADFVFAVPAILLLSALSFLGLGARPPDPEWGSMVSTGAQHFEAWWIGVFPGIAIVSIVLAFNFLGDSLRDAFDPKTIIKARGA